MDFFGKYHVELENGETGTYLKLWKFMYILEESKSIS